MRINCTQTPQTDGRPDPDDIDKLTNAVTAAFAVDELYLFGSAATRKLTNTSDLDVAIAVNRVKHRAPPGRPNEHTMDRVARVAAAKRRLETAIQRTIRKAIGWRRAIDVLFITPGEINEKTSTDDVLHSIQTEGISLVENGTAIPYTRALTNGAIAPNTKGETPDRAHHLYDLVHYSNDYMDWAMLRAGRKNPSPTQRHQIAYMAARALRTALQHRILADSGEPPMQGDLQMFEALRLANSPKSAPIPGNRLKTLASNQQRWRFAGDEPPAMTEMLQCVWDAAAALDTIKKPKTDEYYPKDGITRLMDNLAIRERVMGEPFGNFEIVRKRCWPRLRTS